MDLNVQLTSRESQVVNFVRGFPMISLSFSVSDDIFIRDNFKRVLNYTLF
jgi:hypothetical protein